MKVFAIADLHLSFCGGKLTKPMHRFGGHWEHHPERIAADWSARVSPNDLVLLPGDLSWATRPPEAAEDLAWIDQLTGRKVMLKGNHDFWMPSSRRKLRDVLPASIDFIQHDSLRAGDVVLVGTRLWDVPGLAFEALPAGDAKPTEDALPPKVCDPGQDAKLLTRELQRLQLSLEHARQHHSPECPMVAMTHFPPLDFQGHRSDAADLLAAAGVKACVFGHLHGVVKPSAQPTLHRGIPFYCVAADFLDFRLLEIPLESIVSHT